MFKNSSNLIFLLLVCFVLTTCKKEQTPESTTPSQTQESTPPIQAVVVFALGDVKYGEEVVKTGMVLTEGKKLATGKKSYVDLQFIHIGPDAIIRVRAQSEFQFSKKNIRAKEETNFFVQLGSALFDLKKTKQEDNIIITTPTSHAGVRGTKFITSVAKDKSTTIELLEGSLAVRPFIPELENLPDTLKEQSKVLQEVQKNLESSEVVLEPGKKVIVSEKDTSKFLKDSNLDDTIKLNEIVSLYGQEKPKEEDLKKAVELLDKRLEETKTVSVLQKKIPVKEESVGNKELQKKIKEFEDLLRIEKQKLESSTDKTEVVKTFNKEREKALRKKIEEIFDQSTEVLVLKDGRRYTGVVYEEGNKVIVLTTEGKYEFGREEVETTLQYEE